MNFLFVDRILDLQPGKSTLAIKHITPTDEYLTQDAAGKFIIIPCIIGEALGQLCSWNVIKSSDFNLRLIGGVVGEVVLHSDAYLGDTVILENTVDVLDLENKVVSFHCIAKVGDRIIAEIKNGLGPLLPVADFGDVEKVKAEYQQLYRPGSKPEISESQAVEMNMPTTRRFTSYDRIISWEKGKGITAQKNISYTAPYFADHFPKRPVLPLTLLVESNLQLAYPFIAELLGDTKHLMPKPITVKRIKMNDFVEPGSIVITKMSLLEKTDNKIILQFRSEIEGKRVCTCEAEFNVRS